MDRISDNEKDFRERRRSREPMEFDDRVLDPSPCHSPVFARRDIPGIRSTEATESSSPADLQRHNPDGVENLPNAMHEVALALEDRKSFPSAELAGATERNSVQGNEEKRSLDCEGISRDEIDESEKKSSSEITSSPELVPVGVPEAFPPHPKLRRKSSSLAVKTTSLPKVNCQEKVFLCVDHSEEMFRNKFQTQSTGQTSVFKTLASAMKQFVRTKAFLHKKHQFSLIVLNEDAQLITDLSSNHEALLIMLKDIAESPTRAQNAVSQDGSKVFDLASLFDVIKQQAGLPKSSPKHEGKTPPPHVVRVIFVYGRSDTRLQFVSAQKSFALLNNSPFFFLDCVYIHKPVQENNIVENIFSEMCALDIKGTSHIYEADTDSNMVCLYNIFAKLLAHPLQRPKQGENAVNYNLEALE